MIKKTFLIPLLFLSLNASAEIATPSLFASNKSVNPALINWRYNGITRFKFSSQYVTKKQYVKNYKNAPFVMNQYDDIKMGESSIFLAGKGGGSLTSEFKLSFTKGQRDTTLTDSTVNQSNFSTRSDAVYSSLGFGFNRWGAEFHFLNYKSNYNLDTTINSQNIKSTDDVKMCVFGSRFGYVVGTPDFGLGLIMEFDRMKPKGAIKDFTSQLYYVGFGIGGGKDIKLELNAQVDPITKVASHLPIKISFNLEFQFSNALIGYQAIWFGGRYVDLEYIVQQKMYNNFNGDLTLAHEVNVSLGRSHGFDWGWIFLFTEGSGNEKSTILDTEDRFHTNSRAFAFALKMGKTY